MKRATISLTQLTYQILQEQRAKRIIESVTATATSVSNKLEKLGDEVIAAGMDLTDDEVQAAMLSKLIDAGGNIDKVDASDVKDLEQQVQEGRKYINESGSAAGTIVHGLGEFLGNAALLETISHGLSKILGKKINATPALKKLQKIFKNVSALTGLPGKAVEKFFKFIAAKWGAGEKTQKIFGIAGMMVFVILMAVIAVVSFPSATSFAAIALGVTALVGKAIEMVKLTKHLIHTVSDHQEEIEKIKTPDDRTELQKKIDNWMDAPISGPDKKDGDMFKNMSMYK